MCKIWAGFVQFRILNWGICILLQAPWRLWVETSHVYQTHTLALLSLFNWIRARLPYNKRVFLQLSLMGEGGEHRSVLLACLLAAAGVVPVCLVRLACLSISRWRAVAMIPRKRSSAARCSATATESSVPSLQPMAMRKRVGRSRAWHTIGGLRGGQGGAAPTCTGRADEAAAVDGPAIMPPASSAGASEASGAEAALLVGWAGDAVRATSPSAACIDPATAAASLVGSSCSRSPGERALAAPLLVGSLVGPAVGDARSWLRRGARADGWRAAAGCSIEARPLAAAGELGMGTDPHATAVETSGSAISPGCSAARADTRAEGSRRPLSRSLRACQAPLWTG